MSDIIDTEQAPSGTISEDQVKLALRRVKALVSPRQFQIFSCYVLKGWSPERVKKELGVNAAQVYLAKHRVGRILKREAAKLAEEQE